MIIEDVLFILLILYTLGYVVAAFLVTYWDVAISKQRIGWKTLHVAVVCAFLSWYTVYLFIQSIKQLKKTKRS